MTPDQWLSNEFGDEYFSGEFDHLTETINRLNLQPKKSKIVTIAGTNGKGQTARLLASLVKNSHKSYALWTSPHLETVCERFVFNGQLISSQDLLSTMEHAKKLLGDSVKSYSYFEFIFISFLVYLKANPVEVILLEVGLGGRLDASNAVKNDIAVVVSISREHQRLLGKTYQKILFEKLGITNTGKKLMTCFELDYLRQKTKEFIKNRPCDWSDLFQNKIVNKADDFSNRNIKLACSVYEALFNKQPDALSTKVDFAMRKSVVCSNRVYDFYPTHNLDGFRKLFQFLSQRPYNKYDYLLISFSKREWKDLLGICQLIKTKFKAERIKLVHFSHFKSVDESQLYKLQSEFKFDIIKLDEIYKNKEKTESRILVTGSNYFLGHVLQYFSSKQ